MLRLDLGYGEEFSVNTEAGLLYDIDETENLDKKFSELGMALCISCFQHTLIISRHSRRHFPYGHWWRWRRAACQPDSHYTRNVSSSIVQHIAAILQLCSLDALEDKPLKSLDLVKAENGERPIPPRPAPPLPASATNGTATNGNGIQTNGNGTKHSLDFSDEIQAKEPTVLAKRPRSETINGDDQATKRAKISLPNGATIIEDDDGAIVLDWLYPF